MNRFLDHYVKLADHLAWKMVDNEAVVLDLREISYFTLNDVASRVWQCADGRRTIEEIVMIIAGEYAGDADQVRSDITALLGNLADRHLVEFSPIPFLELTKKPGAAKQGPSKRRSARGATALAGTHGATTI
jgi:hypothetical protein